jgi:hypothetical protein
MDAGAHPDTTGLQAYDKSHGPWAVSPRAEREVTTRETDLAVRYAKAVAGVGERKARRVRDGDLIAYLEEQLGCAWRCGTRWDEAAAVADHHDVCRHPVDRDVAGAVGYHVV